MNECFVTEREQVSTHERPQVIGIRLLKPLFGNLGRKFSLWVLHKTERKQSYRSKSNTTVTGLIIEQQAFLFSTAVTTSSSLSQKQKVMNV